MNELLGKVLVSITGAKKGSCGIIFETSTGEKYHMFHDQDCCESLSVEDVCGEVSDLIGEPILQAEESSGGEPEGIAIEFSKSHTWTFYRLGTIKGQVVIRWLGESNGYYSESVSFNRISP